MNAIENIIQNLERGIRNVAREIRRALCRHKPKCVGHEVIGATLSWSAQVTREYRFTYRCEKCGHRYHLDGFVIPGDRKLHPDRYNADGWPIDRAGKKLTVRDP